MCEDKMRRTIPFSPPDISELEIAEVAEALRSGWITTGPRTKLLERRLAAYIETGKTVLDTEKDPERWNNRVVCLNSATAAEEMNLRLIGIGPGDEVIVPAYTYSASASAALHCGASVKFVDIQKDGDPVTHMPEMDYDALEAAITEKTKAIITVDLGGISFGTYSYGRLWISSSSSGADPNYLSEWFILPLVFICEELVNDSNKLIIKMLIILELVIIVGIVFLTASRSGFVTSTAVVLLAMMFSFKNNIRRRPLIALLVVILMIAGVYFAIQYIPETLVHRITGTKSLGQRGQIWSQLLLAMRGDWIKTIFGFGDNATIYYNDVGLIYGMTGLAAHNTFLDVLFNYGLIGFLCFIYMIIQGIKNRMKKEPYVVIGSFVMCISLFSLSALSTRPIVFMLFLLMCNVRYPQEIGVAGTDA